MKNKTIHMDNFKKSTWYRVFWLIVAIPILIALGLVTMAVLLVERLKGE